jgi:predicted metal-dependent hydrolase
MKPEEISEDLMPTVGEVVRKAERRGIRFTVSGERLNVAYPDGERTEAVEAWIRANKPAILGYLTTTSIRTILKREGIARFTEMITLAERGKLPSQDVFVTVHRTEHRLLQVANLTNYVLYHSKRYERGFYLTALFKLELAKRGYDAWLKQQR